MHLYFRYSSLSHSLWCVAMHSFSALDRNSMRVCFIYIQNSELSRSTEPLRESIHLLARELKYKGNTSESPCSDLSLWQILGFCLMFHLPEPSILDSSNQQPLYSLQGRLLPSDQIKNLCFCQTFQSSLRTSGHYAHQSSSCLLYWIPVGLDPVLAGWWNLR